ncbi:hypothetical protein HRI_001366700 [Hibiscus trionum]|uniref:Uncharacterized protein n=1 Tax=Hibiscus trionum TaxID=183268 RepID=A0A9W7HGE4_HIBTR|nr:hypothetical protein HRI_001366700 [Hibiscus trionum]
MEKKTRGCPKVMKSSAFSMMGFKVKQQEQTKTSHHHHHHSSTSNTPRKYYPADAHHSEAVADCIEFIKKKSSREENRDSRVCSSDMDAISEKVMPVPVT